MKEQLQKLVEERIQKLKVNTSSNKTDNMESLLKKQTGIRKRNGEIVKVIAKGKVKKILEREDVIDAIYETHWKLVTKQGSQFYMEEHVEHRKASFKGTKLLIDQALNVKPQVIEQDILKSLDFTSSRAKIAYDRLKAVQYAERWWNSFNPQYPQFTDDCTNYISQCLYAGGIPMWGKPNRSKGWWIEGKSNWSFSWTVAHAFMLMLKAAAWTKEVKNPSQLMIGDIICYDFEGDGRFNHNTIVTGKDEYGNPLVNAHTTNSRMRYWNYEDSTAYTPNIQYKYFHIITN